VALLHVLVPMEGAVKKMTGNRCGACGECERCVEIRERMDESNEARDEVLKYEVGKRGKRR
jgi:hypothetical protein